MKIFLKKTISLLIVFHFLIIGSYYLIDFYYNTKKSDNTLFIWGDSQAYRGLDLNILNKKTDKKIYTASRHGAGIYDFLVFAEKVPSNSEVLIALSKPVQLRRKQRDRNRAGISISALISLLDNNYSWSEIISIIKNSIKPIKLFSNNTSMFPYSDSIVLSKPISYFENSYNEIPDYLEDKQVLMLKGIRVLKDKDCDISFIEFPFHPILQEIENMSDVKLKIEQFKNQVKNEFQLFENDTIYLEKDVQVMYDLTHLNEIGASLLSDKLADLIMKHEHTTLYIVRWRDIDL